MRVRASRPTANSSPCSPSIEGAYRIAIQDLANGNVQVLSKGRQEESPSFAPNGAMLIFAGRERGQGVLQTVSVDGQVSARLDADAGEVREPVWGPFLPCNNPAMNISARTTGMTMKNLVSISALLASLALLSGCPAKKPDVPPAAPGAHHRHHRRRRPECHGG